MPPRKAHVGADAPQPIVSIQPSPRTHVMHIHWESIRAGENQNPDYPRNWRDPGSIYYTEGYAVPFIVPPPIVGNVAVRITFLYYVEQSFNPLRLDLVWGEPRNFHELQPDQPQTSNFLAFVNFIPNFKYTFFDTGCVYQVNEPTAYVYRYIPENNTGPFAINFFEADRAGQTLSVTNEFIDNPYNPDLPPLQVKSDLRRSPQRFQMVLEVTRLD